MEGLFVFQWSTAKVSALRVMAPKLTKGLRRNELPDHTNGPEEPVPPNRKGKVDHGE